MADSGTSGHYMAFSDASALLDVRPCTAGQAVTVSLPDGSTVTSTHTATLDLPSLPQGPARTVHLFPSFTGSLLSMSVFCDAGLSVQFDSDQVTVRAPHGPPVLQGTRCPRTRLWFVNLPVTPPPTVSTAAITPLLAPVGDPWYDIPHGPWLPNGSPPCSSSYASAAPLAPLTGERTVMWYHATMGSPYVSTWL
jgi:hypothetical protein